jgi:predicted esterase
VQKNAKSYGGDPNRISIGGSSAGAITSLFTAYSKKQPVRAVIDLWGGMYGKESDIQKGSPALLIVHGRSDRSVAFSNAEALERRAQQVGLNHKALFNNGGHTLDLNTRFDGLTIYEHVEKFLTANS